jgi:hypothetical protein
MLDQHWLGFSSDINDLADDDLNAATALAHVRLWRFAPTAIKQRLRGCHTRLVRRTVSGDARQRLDAQFRVRTRQ